MAPPQEIFTLCLESMDLAFHPAGGHIQIDISQSEAEAFLASRRFIVVDQGLSRQDAGECHINVVLSRSITSDINDLPYSMVTGGLGLQDDDNFEDGINSANPESAYSQALVVLKSLSTGPRRSFVTYNFLQGQGKYASAGVANLELRYRKDGKPDSLVAIFEPFVQTTNTSLHDHLIPGEVVTALEHPSQVFDIMDFNYFPKFDLLPPELRFKIWQMVANVGGRVIVIHDRGEEIEIPRRTQLSRQGGTMVSRKPRKAHIHKAVSSCIKDYDELQALAFVNKETRTFLLGKFGYKIIMKDLLHNNKGILFNYAIDILHISDQWARDAILNPRLPPGVFPTLSGTHSRQCLVDQLNYISTAEIMYLRPTMRSFRNLKAVVYLTTTNLASDERDASKLLYSLEMHVEKFDLAFSPYLGISSPERIVICTRMWAATRRPDEIQELIGAGPLVDLMDTYSDPKPTLDEARAASKFLTTHLIPRTIYQIGSDSDGPKEHRAKYDQSTLARLYY
ncbi:hypothetical protein B0O99DRAFT_746171 [Bisporella sp. PMI_857]|nr:hypothetical protein B0O99DRAFT_746171 [Bisporella sp. PMI_857]